MYQNFGFLRSTFWVGGQNVSKFKFFKVKVVQILISGPNLVFKVEILLLKRQTVSKFCLNFGLKVKMCLV